MAQPRKKVKPNITTDWLIMTCQRSFTNCNILVCDVDGGNSYVGEVGGIRMGTLYFLFTVPIE